MKISSSGSRSFEDRADKTAFPIVGIGASAGGLEAIEIFLASIPNDSGMAFVVVQHLEPNHPALLVEILARSTSLPVCEGTEGMKVVPNSVYVIPPNRDMSILRGTLHLFALKAPLGPRLAIDYFFRSMAEDRPGLCAGVILSGMGSDGTLGIRTIKEAAGFAVAQDPQTAKFDSMPRNAIESGQVDCIAPADQLYTHIAAFFAGRIEKPVDDPVVVEKAISRVIHLLRARTQHDFSQYKRSTLLRRIERRMGIHRRDTVQSYAEFLQANPSEIDLLFAEVLIGVTRFFRDAEVWEYLKTAILPDLISRQADGATLRAWTPACSTGEEAYTLGMIFKEVANDQLPQKRSSLKIFATDLDSEAISKARQAVYPASICQDVSSERLERFFTSDEDNLSEVQTYRIGNIVREMITFAPQDILRDPPFTKLDILVCRNLLIYLEPEAQRRLIRLFHYSLKPGGLMILGNAESIGSLPELFTPLDTKLRIFQRNPDIQRSHLPDFPTKPNLSGHEQAVLPEKSKSTKNLQSLADELLLQSFTPAAVLINPNGDIIYLSGRTGKYLEPAAGKANFNVFAMAREGLRLELTSAAYKAMRTNEAVIARGLDVKTNGHFQKIDLTVQQIDTPEELKGLLLVVFQDVAGSVPFSDPGKGGIAMSSDSWRSTERELQRMRQELLAHQNEMQIAREQSESVQEELQSANEELQSTNEELTTSKEEMQSLNEELQTVNAELQSKVNELLGMNNDMKNLLNSTEIATVFLDETLKLRRYTTEATKVFKLIPSDVGRLITDLVSNLVYEEFVEDVHSVSRTLSTIEKHVATKDNRTLSVRIMPYRTIDNVIDGVVVTFMDITAYKKLEAELERLERNKNKPVD